MKKIVLYTLIAVFCVPFRLFAIGLGGLAVHSYLDQPFQGEIELLDVGNTPLNGIKVSLASPEDFDRVGLERVYALNLLSFSIEKNKHGKPIIKISSVERISEPYMQLMVDLAWANGQVYRSYNILLDPPNYKLMLVRKQLRSIVKRQSQTFSKNDDVEESDVSEEQEHSVSQESATYGPVVPGETIWQIAQRYKTEDILLQQMILAIVGTNPSAFTEGNLNGLVVGSRLQIPSIKVASKVPATYAKSEVLAQDNAWQTRKPIVHALMPPYINSDPPTIESTTELSPLGYPLTESKIPSMLDTYKENAPTSQLLPISVINNPLKLITPEAQNNAVIDVSTTAINSMREANAALTEQLRTLQADNKRLKEQLSQRKQSLDQMRTQIKLLSDKQKAASETHSSSIWMWILLLIVLAIAIMLVHSRMQGINKRKATDENISPEAPPIDQDPIAPVEPSPLAVVDTPVEVSEENLVPPETTTIEQPPTVSIKPSVESTPTVVVDTPLEITEENIVTPEEPVIETEVKTESEKSPELKANEHILEFEPNLKESNILENEDIPIKGESLDATSLDLPEELGDKDVVEEAKPNKGDNSIDFEVLPSESLEVSDKPVKSKAALETLLSLAKTYMTMDDVESAVQSLQEVIDFGNKKQKAEATRLLNQLQKK